MKFIILVLFSLLNMNLNANIPILSYSLKKFIVGPNYVRKINKNYNGISIKVFDNFYGILTKI